MKILAPILALALSFAATASHAENLSDWAEKRRIAIDTTAESGLELKEGAAQLPIAVRLHTGNFDFTIAKPDGSDIRVAGSDGKTPLRFHVEKFDTTNELGVLWVQLPKVTPAARADSITLFWGNEKAASAADMKGTFDAVQTLVLHFDDKTGATQTVDATGANSPREATVQLGAIGPLGGAAAFDGSSSIVVSGNGSFKFVANVGMTFTAWLKPGDIQAGTLFEQGALKIGLSGGNLAVSVNGKEVRANNPLRAGEWQQIAVTLGAGKASFYVDGLPAGSADVALADMAGDAVIGKGYRGDMDEVTVAAAMRSPAYLAALFGGQEPDGLLLAFDATEESGGEAGYMGILLDSLTVDGWVVIAILGVMAVISGWVMVSKTRFLHLAQKSNALFINHFRSDSAALLTPGSAAIDRIGHIGNLEHSPIYRLYEMGVSEMQQRFTAMQERNQETILSGASLDAIRASIDAVQVRENQRLNSQIVLLTIAISGGPFLGLLGTVVGVMITFAAIAAAGDVNVNAIAPGIAAALLATVAGLAVAIPALFGYNWLTSEIKNVSADMQIFADEFVTRAAELHSR